MLAVRGGDLARINQLLDAGTNVNCHVGNVTPMMQATWGNRHDVMRLLAQRGADVNAGNTMGEKPLMLAAGRGDVVGTGILLNAGADPSATDIHGQNALDKARMIVPGIAWRIEQEINMRRGSGAGGGRGGNRGRGAAGRGALEGAGHILGGGHRMGGAGGEAADARAAAAGAAAARAAAAQAAVARTATSQSGQAPLMPSSKGFETDRFEGPVPDEFICQICLDVVGINPTQHRDPECERIFCGPCLAGPPPVTRCPICRAHKFQNECGALGRVARQRHGALRLRCSKGCREMFTIATIVDHERICNGDGRGNSGGDGSSSDRGDGGGGTGANHAGSDRNGGGGSGGSSSGVGGDRDSSSGGRKRKAGNDEDPVQRKAPKAKCAAPTAGPADPLDAIRMAGGDHAMALGYMAGHAGASMVPLVASDQECRLAHRMAPDTLTVSESVCLLVRTTHSSSSSKT